ncbi:hypothetical protein Q8A73_000673 [Channa argus]|nr:hypothetical protein Q8A73_000673 [Channa argus]
MSSPPEAPAGGADSSVLKPSQLFKSCWSCRVISGGGLILSGAYVFNAARKVMRQGGPTSMGTVAQVTFAASLAAWGIVIIADPVGKSQRKTWLKSSRAAQCKQITEDKGAPPNDCSRMRLCPAYGKGPSIVATKCSLAVIPSVTGHCSVNLLDKRRLGGVPPTVSS